ncbi:beta-ketoacyl-[acyl-carrier-protein] synthase family protein [Streptomyces ficellus]|uniref:Beta-ketoacyl-[acyl-carrier-protein] synthase family protein n=1 Tax=Streptomyces ficellus TaxID=1977088 RepID=A0A6I6EZH5_9ACTN|nr:beta-ketoacyl-[acyl-carrier-protein] synthase family protein [Streptomyces ficellus]QGV76870.1 beta-ketoacyl-[acyl-carrier-protein] synthase family protein [Streptomyces ficellus]
MTREPVAVTGLGLVTPAAVGVKPSWEHLLSGAPTAAPDAALEGMPVDFSCRVPDDALSAALGRGLRWRIDRFIQMAVVAAREAVADAGLYAAEWDGTRVGVVVGVGGTALDHTREYVKVLDGRYGGLSPSLVARSQPGMAAGEVSLDLGAKGPTMCTSTVCASGTAALGAAKLLLDAGACDIVVAGGADSPRCPMGSASFWRMGALSTRCEDPAGASRPFDTGRDGFVLGEGAGILVLERAGHARARSARVYAELAGCGSTADAHHCVAPHPEGDGAARAIQVALGDAGLAPGDVDHVNAHGTGTLLNDQAEARALLRVFGGSPPVTANKSVFGHAIGGAGAIEAVCSVLSLHHGVVPPTANLTAQEPGLELDIVTGSPRPKALNAVVTNSFGFGGHNSVAVFRRP